MYNKGVEGVLWFTISLGIIPYTKIFKMGGGYDREYFRTGKYHSLYYGDTPA